MTLTLFEVRLETVLVIAAPTEESAKTHAELNDLRFRRVVAVRAHGEAAVPNG